MLPGRILYLVQHFQRARDPLAVQSARKCGSNRVIIWTLSCLGQVFCRGGRIGIRLVHKHMHDRL